jgi:Arc/MetJ-type ribon-helix-helix transcriptional regulator
MTIHLPHEVEEGILAAVHSGRFASVDDAMTEAASMLIQRLKHEQVHATRKETGQPADAQAQKPIWEKFRDIAASIPKGVWDKIPADSSEQLDYYLYGTPRRPAR